MQKRKNKNFFSRKQLRNFKKRLTGRIRNINHPTLFLGLGLLFFAIWGIREIHIATRLSFSATIPVNEVSGNIVHPVKISMPTIQTELPIEETLIEKGVWQISERGVSHLATSTYPGNDGNIILYGHNTEDRLARLHNITIGDVVTITSKNGRIFEYKVESIEVVKPTEIDKLMAHTGETLTIYTCIGFADLERILVKAKRV